MSVSLIRPIIFKEALFDEKESLDKEQNRQVVRPDNQGVDMNLNLDWEPKNEHDRQMEKRKVEIETFFEAIDTLVDMKNISITGLEYEKVIC